MKLTPEPFSDTRLDEIIQFVRDANPFSQHNWGWDTGRFVDWRWSGNAVREAASPGWFSRAAAVFRGEIAIRALAVREYGDAAACIITPEEDTEAIHHALGWLIADGARHETGLTFARARR